MAHVDTPTITEIHTFVISAKIKPVHHVAEKLNVYLHGNRCSLSLLSLACRITHIHLTLDNLRQCFGPRECWCCGEPWWQPSLLSLCCLLHVFVSSQSPTVYLGLLVCGLTLQCVDLDVGKLKSSGCSAG